MKIWLCKIVSVRIRAKCTGKRQVGSTPTVGKSSPGVRKSSAAKSGADAPQVKLTRHPSPCGMESKKSNLLASDTRPTHVRHEECEISPKYLFCKDKCVSDKPLGSQKLSLRLPTALVIAIQHEAVHRGVSRWSECARPWSAFWRGMGWRPVIPNFSMKPLRRARC